MNPTFKPSKNGRRILLDVFICGKKVGEIWSLEKGFTYFPKGKDYHGEFFQNLESCKNSLRVLE